MKLQVMEEDSSPGPIRALAMHGYPQRLVFQQPPPLVNDLNFICPHVGEFTLALIK